MMPDVVRRAGPADEDEVVAILMEAFAEHAHGYIFGTGESYRQFAPAYFQWGTERALAAGEVYLVDDKATMLGLPSSRLGTRPDQVQAIHQQLRGLGVPDAVLAFEDSLHRHHPMHTPHWYGWAGGVRLANRGHGLGRLLMRHILREHSDLPYYHEVPSPRIAAIWEKEGFRPIGTFEIADGITMIQQVHEALDGTTVSAPLTDPSRAWRGP